MNRPRGLAALVALVALTVAAPWALLRYGDWPIDGLPSRSQLRDLGESAVSDEAIFAVLTVAAWVVWTLFMGAVIVELVAAVRGVQAPRLTFVGPLQRWARALVAAIVLAATLQHRAVPVSAGAAGWQQFSSRSVAVVDVGTLAGSHRIEAGAAWADPTAEPSSRPAHTDSHVRVVARGDSAWSIAEEHLGDGMRWRELWDLNRGVPQPDGGSWTDPQLIRVGWRLRLPGDASVPQEPGGAPATDSAPAGEGNLVHVVREGDTLSAIAEEYLGDAERYGEILEINRGVRQADGRWLADPNLIIPGWSLRIPSAVVPAVDEPRPQAPAPIDEPEIIDAPPGNESSPETVPDPPVAEPQRPPLPTPPPPTTVPATTAPATTTTPPVNTAPAPTESTPSDPPPTHRDDADATSAADADWSPGPTLVGVGGAVVLATGVGLHIRFLRRRRETRGSRRVRSSEDTARTQHAVAAAGDVPLVRWAGQQLASLLQRLPRHGPGPLAVELSEAAGLEVLWEEPRRGAPRPWTEADGGWAWRLAYDPDAHVPDHELPAGLPALVTIGQRDGRQLMVDLEAYGLVTVSGADDDVDDFLRSIAVELAAGEDLSDSYVQVVNLDVGVDGLSRLEAPETEVALRHLANIAKSVDAALEAAHVHGSFAGRTGSSPPIEATVLVGRVTADELDTLTHAAPARRGVAAVVAGDGGAAPAHIEIRNDGTAMLTPLAVEFSAAGLPSRTAERLTEALHELEGMGAIDSDLMATEVSTDLVTVETNDPVQSTLDELPAEDQARELLACLGGRARANITPEHEHEVLVRVLGTPRIVGRPELGRREVILAALLACRGGSLAASAAQDALWGGKPVESKTVWNVVAATRRALGEFEDGTPVMPPADRSSNTLRLSPAVLTDLSIMRGLVEKADHSASSEAIELLRQALELVEGPPFDAAGYDWAHRDQDVAEASALIEVAAERLVNLALDAGLVDIARHGISRALRGLPGNEDLYRCRMRIEHQTGNLAGIRSAYEELVTYLADLELEPSPATTALYEELTRPQKG